MVPFSLSLILHEQVNKQLFFCAAFLFQNPCVMLLSRSCTEPGTDIGSEGMSPGGKNGAKKVKNGDRRELN